MANASVKVTRARFVVRPYSPDEMVEAGASVIGSIFRRWDLGLDLAGVPAKPLTARYARSKAKRQGRPIRDLNLTGRLRSSIQVLSPRENGFTIGPIDGGYPSLFARKSLSFSDVLEANQQRANMWGIGQAEREVAMQFLREHPPVSAQIVKVG